MTITYKYHYGYVGATLRASTLIKVDGVNIARVWQSGFGPRRYVAEFSLNRGRNYAISVSLGTDKIIAMDKAEKEAIKIVKGLAKKSARDAKCLCREPKAHRDCAYCGYGGPCTQICGRCRDGGIDGNVIRGTERRTCEKHKEKTK